MSSNRAGGSPAGLSLEAFPWHLNRQDYSRASASARAGAVLSTNALIVAGTALAFSVQKAHRLGSIFVTCCALGSLAFVAGSITLATMALISLRSWGPRWTALDGDGSGLYAYDYYSQRWSTFDEFRASITSMSPEQQLRGATVELWKGGHVLRYRYLKIRASVRCLLVAVAFLLLAISLAVVFR